jgi:polyhydroxybutyrate depolymerase
MSRIARTSLRRNRVRTRRPARELVLAVSIGLLTSFVGGAVAPAWAEPDQSNQLEFGGLTRTYTVHVPAGVTHPIGLVVALHGLGGTGRVQQAATHYDSVADEHGFAVVYPDGVDRSWADGRGSTEADAHAVDDVGFITALVGKLAHKYRVDSGHVFATGMSNGAFMANRLACDRADLFSAVAPVSGTLGANVRCTPSRPVAVLAVHGTADRVIPFNGGRVVGKAGQATVLAAPAMAARWRSLDDCAGIPAESTVRDNEVHRFASSSCGAGTAVVFMQIDGGGHTWPDGATGFDASEASARFFATHAR